MLGKGVEFNQKNILDINKNNLIKQKEDYSSIVKNVNKNQKMHINKNYLVEYFYGMILNYINLEKRNKEILDEEIIYLENEIKNYYKQKINKKFFGGTTKINISTDIQYDCVITYVNYNNENNNIIHYINIQTNNEDLTIDLEKEIIINNKDENQYKINSPNEQLETLLEIIIKKMIYIFCESSDYVVYKHNNPQIINIKPTKSLNKMCIYKSVLSLLIIILSLRRGMNKNIYAKYYNTWFLMDYYYNFLEATNTYKFGNINSNIILTYSPVKYIKENHIFSFDGDCSLNTLMCIKNPDIQKLLIKKKYIVVDKNKLTDKEIKEYEENIMYYIDNMVKVDIEDDYINKIKTYINGYKIFINTIKNVYSEINILLNNDDESIERYIELNNKLKLFVKYHSVIMSILIDCNSDDLEYYINNSKDDANKIKQLSIIIDGCVNLEEINKNEIKKLLPQVLNIYHKYINIINNCEIELFYLNFLISLKIFYYKVEYLFDEKILKCYNHPTFNYNAIKRFCNIDVNKNEIDRFKFMYLNINNSDFYFSRISSPHHCMLIMIEVNNENSNYCICDLNNLNFICVNNNIEPNDEKNINNEYFYNFGRMRYNHNHYYYAKAFKDTGVYIENYTDVEKVCDTLEKRYLKIYNKENNMCLPECYCNFFKNTSDYKKNKLIKILIKLINAEQSNKKINRYQNKYFIYFINYIADDDDELIKAYKKIFTEINIKELIIDRALLILNECSGGKCQECRKYAEVIKNNIRNESKCTVDNMLYYFIDLIYHHILNEKIDENEFYSIICDYNTINWEKLEKYLRTENTHESLINAIKYIINILSKVVRDKKITGGQLQNTINYNSIIKRIIIVILIIIVLIIIVLIVLFIINKYKNNESKV